jgi:tripartite-type tricarboxylate transporter receptor subunit TctC
MGIVGAASLLLTSVAFASASSASVAAKKAKKVQPDFSYFSGQTITLDSPGSPGGSYDGMARILAPALATFLHANVNVIDYSNSIQGQDVAGNAAPNGLTIGELNMAGAVDAFATSQPYTNFAIKTATYLGGLLTQEDDVVVTPSSGIKSLSQLVDDPAAVGVLDTPTSFTDLNLRVLTGVYGVKSSFITGYANNPAILTGFLRGDGVLTMMGNATVEGAIATGQAVPIAMTDPLQAGMLGYARLKYDKPPTYAKLLATDPPKTKAGVAALKELVQITQSPVEVWFTPKGTPANIALALQRAIRSIMNQPGIQKALIGEGFYTNFFDSAQVTADTNRSLKNISTIVQYLNG